MVENSKMDEKEAEACKSSCDESIDAKQQCQATNAKHAKQQSGIIIL